MSSEPVAIEVVGLSKSYRLGTATSAPTTLREAIMQRLSRRAPPQEPPILWALRDVDLEVRCGEVLGIVGANGSGKSTLLKILSRITAPTRGEARLRGRVGSLLEVGTGFHPDLTGRENIFLSGRILGLRTSEIRRHYDEIVAFSGVEKMLETPVKRYSSGQYMRLAFSVAAFLQPEILLVDEVLAVGDADFQHRCLGRMRSVARGGRTVVFVSHNTDAIVTLCSRAVLLEEGRIVADGPAAEVVARYLFPTPLVEVTSWRGSAGDHQARLLATEVRSEDGGPLRTDAAIRIRFTVEVLCPLRNFICGVELYSREEKMLAYSLYDDRLPPPPVEAAPGRFAHEVVIPRDTLSAGAYELRFDVGIHNVHRIVYDEGSLWFRLANPAGLGRRFDTERIRNRFRPGWTWRTIEEREAEVSPRRAVEGDAAGG